MRSSKCSFAPPFSRLVEGKQQLGAKLAASIEFNSQRIAELEEGRAFYEKSDGSLKAKRATFQDAGGRQQT